MFFIFVDFILHMFLFVFIIIVINNNLDWNYFEHRHLSNKIKIMRIK